MSPLTAPRQAAHMRAYRARKAMPVYSIVKCGCVPTGCYIVVRSIDGGPGESVARFDTEDQADLYVRSLPGRAR